MEHSLRAYLERLPAEKLECFLQDCRSGDVSENYNHLIPLVLEVLAQRDTEDGSAS